jgi:DUF4097 and DUF4098 domain-containing protein YvlB
MSFVTSTPLPTVLFSALTVLAVTGCGVNIDIGADVHRTERTTVDATGVTSLIITTDNGDVDVVAGSGDIEVTALISEHDAGDAEHSVEIDDGAVTIMGTCDDGWFGNCEVTLQVTAPADLDVTVVTDNGDVSVTQRDGRLDLSTNNGGIDAMSIDSGLVRSSTDNGDVDLAFKRPPDRVDISTDNGSVLVEVPPCETAYAVEASSDNGDVRVDVTTDPTSRRVITAESDNGAVTVRHPAG